MPAIASAPRPTDRTTAPTALAVDLGSHTAGVWAAHRGTLSGPCGDAYAAAGTPVRRGRVVDVAGCVNLLSHLIRRYPQPVPAGGVVVACRPVLTSEADQDVTRHVLDLVFAPARVLFIDTVRAAAVGSGAAAGTLLIVDGAAHPRLALAVSGALRMPVHRAANPRMVALNGARLAAMSLLRHPAGA